MRGGGLVHAHTGYTHEVYTICAHASAYMHIKYNIILLYGMVIAVSCYMEVKQALHESLIRLLFQSIQHCYHSYIDSTATTPDTCIKTTADKITGDSCIYAT